MKNLIKIIVPIIVLVAALVVVEIFYCGNRCVPGTMSAEKAAQKALDFINNVALQGQATASLTSVAKESGLYKVNLKIGDQEYESYVTKDAKLLFAQGTKITAEDQGADTGNLDFPKTDKPEVNLFVMSFCPYGNQAEELMIPVVDLLKDKADIKLNYVIYSNYNGGGDQYCLDKESKYCSMHGIQELNQDVREMCVQKYQNDKFWKFVTDINQTCTAQNVDSCWESVAQRGGINVNKIKTCQRDEAINLLKQETTLNQQYGISGSPQVVINGKEYTYTGAQTAETFKTAICSAFNTAPEECNQTLSNEGGSTSGGCE